MVKLSRIIVFLVLTGCTLKNTELQFDDLAAKQANPEFDTDYELIMPVGNRNYVASVFEEVFQIQPGDADASLFFNFIYFRPEFGGSCDPYAGGKEIVQSVTSAGVTVWGREFQFERCLNGVIQTLPPQFNSMRYAWTTRTCESLIKNTNGIRLTQLMQQLYPGWTVANANQSSFAPTSETVTLAYRKFYRLDDPAPEVLQGLLTLGVPQSKSNLDRWKLIWITVCISPEWQMIQ